MKVIGDEFRPGMVFAFNIDLFDPKWRDGETGCVFAETIESPRPARGGCTVFRPSFRRFQCERYTAFRWASRLL